MHYPEPKSPFKKEYKVTYKDHEQIQQLHDANCKAEHTLLTGM
jgi:hypothetical protein